MTGRWKAVLTLTTGALLTLGLHCPSLSLAAGTIADYSVVTDHSQGGQSTYDRFSLQGIAPWHGATRVMGPNGYDQWTNDWWDNLVRYNYKDGMYYEVQRWSGLPLLEGDYTLELYEDRDDSPIDSSAPTAYQTNQLDAVDMTGATPVDGAYVNTTTPAFTWPEVTDETAAVYYRLVIEECNQARVVYISDKLTTLSHTVLSGYLAEHQTYKWQIEVYDAGDSSANNVSRSNYAYFSTGSGDPAVTPLVVNGAYMRSRVRTNDRHYTQMGVSFSGPSPDDVEVFVEGPLGEPENATRQIEGNNYFQDGFFAQLQEELPAGTYRFTVTDLRPGAGSPETVDRTLAPNWTQELVDVDSINLDDDQYLDTDRPTITWQPTDPAMYYRLEIWSADWQTLVYQEYTHATQVTVPADTLDKDTAYWVRVETYDQTDDPLTTGGDNGNRGSGDAAVVFVANNNDPASLSGTISAGASGAGGPIYIVVQGSQLLDDGPQYGWTLLEAPGSYTVHNVPRETDLYIHVIYDVDGSESFTAGDYHDLYETTPITLPATGGTLTGYDVTLATLTPGASVSGTVTCDNYTSGSIYIGALPYEDDPPLTITEVETCPATYTIDNLPVGGRFFLNAFWDADGSGTFTSLDHGGTHPGNPIFVASGGNSGVDIHIETTGRIAGTVTVAGVGPIENLHVYFEDAATGNYIGGTNTDSSGFYSYDLPDGSYNVRVCPSCSGEPYAPQIEVVTVVNPSATTVDFALVPGQVISGYVTEEGSSPAVPIEGLWVEAFGYATGDGDRWDEDMFVAGTMTNSDGYYEIHVEPGSYKVRACAECEGLPYVDEFHEDGDWGSATEVVVVNGADREINFALISGGIISGTVYEDGSTTTPIANLRIEALDAGTQDYANETYTDDSGYYELRLKPGTYKLQAMADADGHPYVNEYYNDARSWDLASTLTVSEGSNEPNVDFALSAGNIISGTVTLDSPAGPIEGIIVDVQEWGTGTVIASAQTDTNGLYTIHVAPGLYQVKTCASCDGLPYVDEYYDNTTGQNPTQVDVSGDQDRTDIDFVLSTGGIIEGHVKDESDASIANLHIYFSDSATGEWIAGVNTDFSGYYIVHLNPGTYDVTACSDCSGLPFVRETRSDISVSVSTPAIVDFTLLPGSTISGTVYMDDSGDPMTGIDDIYVSAISGDPCGTNEYLGRGEIDPATGNFSITGLPTGDIYIQTDTGCNFYIDQTYDNDPNTTGGCEEIDPIQITAPGQEITGKDFTLALGGMITGTITETDQTAISQLYVSAYDLLGNHVAGRSSDDNGFYCLKVPAAVSGTDVKVEACASCSWQKPYINEYYQNAYDWDAAATVTVELGFETPDIDFSLARIVPGDFDGDEDMDLTDLIRGLQMMSGITPSGHFFKTGDTNDNNVIGMEDVLYIFRNL